MKNEKLFNELFNALKKEFPGVDFKRVVDYDPEYSWSLTLECEGVYYFAYSNGFEVHCSSKNPEENSAKVEEKPVETSENYSTISKSENFFDSDYEEYENSLSSFDELASMVGCENFTDEECARELSYLLYADVDLANEYLHELHPFDQETLYAFYVAAKDGFNTSWKYNDDAPLGFYCDGKKIFFAYSEEEKGE